MYFDPMYFIFALPALILGLWAQWRVKSSYSKYAKVAMPNGLSGAEVARRLLDVNGLQHVRIEPVGGMLSDHYDPRSDILRLSPEVFQGRTIAAAGIAAHETGHALQDQKKYVPLVLRGLMVPTVQFGSMLGPIVFLVGFFFLRSETIAWIGIALFGLVAAFSVITLPVEFDASNRAKQQLVVQGILTPNEMKGVNQVLNAAAMTYVAAAAQSLSTLLYYVMLVSGGRRRN